MSLQEQLDRIEYNKKVAKTIDDLVRQRDTLLAAAKAALPWMLVERREGKQRADELREAIAQAEVQP